MIIWQDEINSIFSPTTRTNTKHTISTNLVLSQYHNIILLLNLIEIKNSTDFYISKF